MIMMSSSLLLWELLLQVAALHVARANPQSKPYIPFRTDPFDQPTLHHKLDFPPDTTKSNPKLFDPETAVSDPRCPLQFSLGTSRRFHHTSSSQQHAEATSSRSIHRPPVIFPVLPANGPGRQVIYTTQYEHFDMLTPSQATPDMDSIGNNNIKQQQTTILKEALTQHFDFPLLFESSSFLTTPQLGDVNGDGIVDAVLTDYDGGVYAIGLQHHHSAGGQRYFHKAQVPRLYVRRQWMESKVNETLGIPDPTDITEQEEQQQDEEQQEGSPKDKSNGEVYRRVQPQPHEPYHSYFEYSYGQSHDHESILRGVTDNVLGQASDHLVQLEERRKRKALPPNHAAALQEETLSDGLSGEENISEDTHRRLEETDPESEGDTTSAEYHDVAKEAHDVLQEAIDGAGGRGQVDEETQRSVEDERAEGAYRGDDLYMGAIDDDVHRREYYGDDVNGGEEQVDRYGADDDYPRYDDEYRHYDDYYGRYDSASNEYYDEHHYVRLPPHILCDPVLAEFPKLYSDKGETEMLLFLAVSYYFDEDEGFFSYNRFQNTDQGDETEVQRGQYVANAIMVYHYGTAPRWGRQEHLDLSGDHTAPSNATLVGQIPVVAQGSKLGAFAVGSPTIADLNGNGELDVLIATSMGFVYCLDARNLYKRDNWPVQFEHSIEHRILVEDVWGDTNLEVFVVDTGGNLVCLDHSGQILWHRNLLTSVSGGIADALFLASSPMVLGDVNGDGTLDITITVKIQLPESRLASQLIYALSAESGLDLPYFPVRLKGASNDEPIDNWIHHKLPPPLLVDLHGDTSHLEAYIRRNGTKWTKPAINKSAQAPLGGRSGGLHVVQPFGAALVIIEAASGCTQAVAIGEEIKAMVQADDVHGTNGLDLVVSTASGNIVTFESPAPFHPLNVWNRGEVRGSTNAFAHGYSASQGIFVHEVSRQFRDIFGVYVPVTFEIFDNRPNIRNEPDRRVYNVEIKEATFRAVFRKTYTSPGVFTERLYIPYGPGYYSLTVVLSTSHGLRYEDTFHLGYNVKYMEGFGILLWLPLFIGSACILLCGSTKSHWDDEDFEGGGSSDMQGILGNPSIKD